MDRDTVVQHIESLFEKSCLELFSSLGNSITPSSSAASALCEAPLSCIDAGSTEVELLIGLQLPMSVLALTFPVHGDIYELDEQYLEDWGSELSNQLLGRLKSKLLVYDCDIKLGLPTTSFGEDISPLSECSEQSAFYFNLDGEACGCYISIEMFSDEMSFALNERKSDYDHVKGELELF